MREEIYSEYNQKLLSLDKNDPTYEMRKKYLKNQMEQDIDAVNSKTGKGKRKFQDIDSKIADAVDSRKNKNDP